MKFAQTILALSTLGIAASADANITVTSYSMQDGANAWGAYYDNAYTGSHSPSGFLSGGTGDLTDGGLTASVAAGYGAWAPYVLWYGQSPVITFDLGATHTVNNITAYFKYFPSAAVYIPASAHLRFSNDGLNFGSDQLRTFTAAETNPGGNDSNGIYQLLATPASGRYVELTLNNDPANLWIALSEVTFDGSATSPVPVPAALWLLGSGLLGLVGVARHKAA
jgi:F5/8 type C domain